VAGRAKSLNGLGFVAKEEGEAEESRGYYEESLRLYREIDDEWGIVWTATDLALVLLHVGDAERAVELLQESMDRQHRRLVRGRSGLALTTIHLAYARAAQQDRVGASELANRALTDSRSMGYRRGVILGAEFTGLLELSAKRLPEARALFTECLALSREVGDRGGMADALEGLAAVTVSTEELEAAARFRLAELDLRAAMSPRARRIEYEPVAVPADLLDRIDTVLPTLRQRGPQPLEQVIDEALGRTN